MVDILRYFCEFLPSKYPVQSWLSFVARWRDDARLEAAVGVGALVVVVIAIVVVVVVVVAIGVDVAVVVAGGVAALPEVAAGAVVLQVLSLAPDLPGHPVSLVKLIQFQYRKGLTPTRWTCSGQLKTYFSSKCLKLSKELRQYVILLYSGGWSYGVNLTWSCASTLLCESNCYRLLLKSAILAKYSILLRNARSAALLHPNLIFKAFDSANNNPSASFYSVAPTLLCRVGSWGLNLWKYSLG